MIKKLCLPCLFVVTALLVGSCGWLLDPPDPDPFVNEGTLFETTAVVPDLALLGASEGYETITLCANTVSAGDLHVGGIIASGVVDELAPYGFLRKITAVSEEGHTLVISTAEGTLADAFEHLHLRIEHPLDASTVVSSVAMVDGVAFQPSPRSGASGALQFDYSFDEAFLGLITVDGALALDMGYVFDIYITTKERRVSFSGHVDADAQLSITVGGAVSNVKVQQEVFTHTFAPITVRVAGLPVVLVPEVGIILDIDVDGYATASASVSAAVSTAVTIDYDSERTNKWSNSSRFQREFDHTLPTLNADVEAVYGAGARFAVELFGRAGGFVRAVPALELAANINNAVWWEYFARLKVDVGMHYDVLFREDEREYEGLIDLRVLLSQSSTPAPMRPEALDTMPYRELVDVMGGEYDQMLASREGGKAGEFLHTVSDFRIGKYPVTYELWYGVYTWAIYNGYTFENYSQEGSSGMTGAPPTVNKHHPVAYINWRDAIAWCNAYSEVAGLDPVYRYAGEVFRGSDNPDHGNGVTPDWTANGYRLPTEGEWQYAATDDLYTEFNHACGANARFDDAAATGAVAWYRDNSGSSTKTVGTKDPGGADLYDMSGNVWEWCWDSIETYPSTPQTDYRGSTTEVWRRVQKGGGANSEAYSLQVGFRRDASPSQGFNFVGIRVAQSSP